MQIEKSKKLITSLLEICDETVNIFYLAATSGLVANKMSCIDYSFRMIYETSKTYNILSKDTTFIHSINTTIQKLSTDVESVESTFGIMFNSVRQYRAQIKAWLDVLDQA